MYLHLSIFLPQIFGLIGFLLFSYLLCCALCADSNQLLGSKNCQLIFRHFLICYTTLVKSEPFTFICTESGQFYADSPSKCILLVNIYCWCIVTYPEKIEVHKVLSASVFLFMLGISNLSTLSCSTYICIYFLLQDCKNPKKERVIDCTRGLSREQRAINRRIKKLDSPPTSSCRGGPKSSSHDPKGSGRSIKPKPLSRHDKCAIRLAKKC